MFAIKRSISVSLVLLLLLFALLVILSGAFSVGAQAGTPDPLTHANAELLALKSDNLRLQSGNSEVIALLALRSMNLQYTPQGFQALTNASFLDLPVRLFNGQHGPFFDVDYSPDGKTVVTANGDGSVTIWDVATGKEVRTFSVNAVYRARFSPDGTMIVTGGFDHSAILWDLSLIHIS